MNHLSPFRYLGAVLLDWAGTTVDYGSRAPAEVFCKLFERCGVRISMAEAREPMGRSKRDHIEAITRMPRVAQAWRDALGEPPTAADIDRMYDEFLPLQLATLEAGTDVIPGVPETIAHCRSRGLKIGSTTGYSRALMEVVVPQARLGGYEADVVVCADEVPEGRPAPWLNFRAAERLGVYPMRRIVVVDDTPVGIAAGRHAGAWTVAVLKTGNALGFSRTSTERIPLEDWNVAREIASGPFREAGVDFLIDGVADLLPVLEQIEAQAGALPPSQR